MRIFWRGGGRREASDFFLGRREIINSLVDSNLIVLFFDTFEPCFWFPVANIWLENYF